MKRSTVTLIVLLVLFLVFAVVLLRQPGETSGPGTTGAGIAKFDTAAIDRMEVRSRAGLAVLERQAEGWMVTVPVRYPADPAGVAEAIAKAGRSEVKSVVSTNPGKQSLFDVDSTGALVTLSAGGSVKAAFRVGKPGPSYAETYVRRENTDEVLLVDGLLTYVYAKPPGEWRDKSIFSSRPEMITAATFHFGDTTFSLSRKDTVWTVDDVPARDQAVQGFLTALSTLQADGFVDTTVSPMPPRLCTIDLSTSQISFFRAPGASQYFVMTSRGPQIFTVSTWKGDQLLKRKKDFLSGAS